MKVNLRKAHAIEKDILSALAKLNISGTATISVHDTNPNGALIRIQQDTNNQFVNMERLERIRAGIRKAVGRANAESGINDLISDNAYHTATIQRREKLIKDISPGSLSLERQIESEKTRMTRDYYHGSETVTVAAISMETVASIRDANIASTRIIKSNNDEILSRNITVTIDIDDAEIDFLRSLGVI